MNVAATLVRCLHNEGVERVYGVPGEETEDLLFALEDSPVCFVPTRHEQGAAFIANVHGRLTGRAGVCLSTLGPGATNLVTGLADAHLDKAPVVAITAQGSMDRMHHESHQAIDVLEMMQPVTLYRARVSSPRVVTEVVRKAFKLAEQEKPGVAHIELPEDMARREVEDSAPLARRMVRRPAPDAEAARRAAELIADAERPLIVAGNGAIRNRASRSLTELATRYDLPVVSTFMGKGAISDALPQSLRTLGLGFRDVIDDAVARADLVITVGFDIAEVKPTAFNPKGDKPIVHIDFDPAEVYADYLPHVEVVGDVTASLQDLCRRLDGAPLSREKAWWMSIRARIVDDIARDRLADDATHMTVPGALHIIRDQLPPDGILLSDVGSHKMWIARNYPALRPNSTIISNGLASMGIALPGAIAAHLVDPERHVVACMGDGGALMNIQELETAHRLGARFVAVILTDDDYGLISWKQERHRGTSTGTRIGNPDFAALARSFGLEACRAETPVAFSRALESALAADAATVIEVPIDPSVNQALVERHQ